MDNNLDLAIVKPKGFDRCKHVWNSSDMVCSENINEMIVASGELIGVICNIRKAVRRLTTGFDDHTILIETHLGKLHPHSAILIIRKPFLFEICDEVGDLSGIVKRAFVKENVVCDPKTF